MLHNTWVARKNSREVAAGWHELGQGCPTGGPRAASGPRPLLIRPATTLHVDHWPVFFCLLCIVHKLTICWTEPVICKYSTTVLAKHSRNQSFIFKNARSSYWGSVPACRPKFYGNRAIPCQNVDTVRADCATTSPLGVCRQNETL